MKYVFLIIGKLLMALVWVAICLFQFLWHLDPKRCVPIGEFCSEGVFTNPRVNMVQWAVVFLASAIVCAIFGFGGIVAKDTTFFKVLFFIFIVLFVLSLLAGQPIDDHQSPQPDLHPKKSI